MSTNKIGKAIKSNCEGDKIMEKFLLDLLEINMSGKKWYKEAYTDRLEFYAKEMENKE